MASQTDQDPGDSPFKTREYAVALTLVKFDAKDIHEVFVKRGNGTATHDEVLAAFNIQEVDSLKKERDLAKQMGKKNILTGNFHHAEDSVKEIADGNLRPCGDASAWKFMSGSIKVIWDSAMKVFNGDERLAADHMTKIISDEVKVKDKDDPRKPPPNFAEAVQNNSAGQQNPVVKTETEVNPTATGINSMTHGSATGSRSAAGPSRGNQSRAGRGGSNNGRSGKRPIKVWAPRVLFDEPMPKASIEAAMEALCLKLLSEAGKKKMFNGGCWIFWRHISEGTRKPDDTGCVYGQECVHFHGTIKTLASYGLVLYRSGKHVVQEQETRDHMADCDLQGYIFNGQRPCQHAVTDTDGCKSEKCRTGQDLEPNQVRSHGKDAFMKARAMAQLALDQLRSYEDSQAETKWWANMLGLTL